ncbi:MAG: hypothetical protein RQ743_12625 [Bacteroidales bacterium]|nr:hypothetical protein [Bacteroidales bacterium]
MTKQKATFLLIITGIILYGILSVPVIHAQAKSKPNLVRYISPDSINPLDIDFNEFLAEDLGAYKIAADMAPVTRPLMYLKHAGQTVC